MYNEAQNNGATARLLGAPTPLASPDTGGVGTGTAQAIASSLLTKENVDKTVNYVKGSAESLHKLVTEGNSSIRVMALCGALVMVLTSALGLFGKVLTLHFVSALMSLYTLVLGCVIIVLEGKMLPIPKMVEAKLYKYCLFLRYVWGRGILYFVAGSIQFSQLNLIDVIIGAFMSFVGIAYIISGRRAAKHLSKMRKALFSEDALRSKFREFDTNGTGSLTYDQFTAFVNSLGLSIGKNEIFTAFSFIDKDENSTIEVEEFLGWWNTWEFDNLDQAQMAV
mmetsp:Transcript_2449/g.3666  ORF Transcript_2449/g.3666 Transcript_2449/m.3666 type:complete len:280 (+) Transcript_2449:155-994(+)|eukprot:CAMPEP_0195531002 /NCGR_PEP_ID=MMETSP0794_2-20130614/34112_1 /TAXON_ID=515487 /ORGANISM="Stephanopyxis turris, Strain CCMP 815" /LENGTH=279 /DNA_ID=CAMNT_0040662631 /DNA_START=155 /DNA_END=994 /DNA_ORIENTATION=+